MSFSSQKGEFDRLFNRLDQPVEESRPDRQPDRCPSIRPVSISGWDVFDFQVFNSSLRKNCAKPMVRPWVKNKYTFFAKFILVLGISMKTEGSKIAREFQRTLLTVGNLLKFMQTTNFGSQWSNGRNVKMVQKFFVVPPTACFLDNLSFSNADNLLQLIFGYQIFHKNVLKARRFGLAMQLIIHV